MTDRYEGLPGIDPAAAAPSRWFAAAVLTLLLIRTVLLIPLLAGGGNPLQPDSPLYLDLARGLAEHRWFSADAETFLPEVFRTPGYPAFLALFRLAGLDGLSGPLLFQELIYLASVGVFYFGTRSLLDVGLARAVVIFLLIEPGGLAYPKMIASDTLHLLFVASAIFALGWHLRSRRWTWLVASGLLLGCAAWVRPAAFLLPVVFAPVLLFAERWRPAAFVRVAVLVITTTLVLSPWLLRNQSLFDKPYLSGQASNMLANYHLPYVWEATRSLPFTRGQEEASALTERAIARQEQRLGRALNTVERLDVQQRTALEALIAYPGAYAQRWVVGILKTLLGPGMLDVYDAYGIQQSRMRFSQIEEASLTRKLQTFLLELDPLVLAEVLLRGLLLALALVGLVVILRANDPFLWVMLLFAAFTVAIPGPMGLTRLRFAAEGFIFLQAWLGLRCLLALGTGIAGWPRRPGV